MTKHLFSNTLLTLVIACGFLSGCGDQKQPSSLPAQTTVKTYQQATTLHGTISNNQGFIEQGIVKATTVGGQLIASTTLENSKNYTVEIPANTPLPLVLNFSSDKGENFVAVVIHPSITQYDINPLTSSIAKKAMSLGGYSDSAMRQAAESSSSIHSASKVSSVDQTKASQHYGGWH